MKRLVIVGAGLSGLSAARALAGDCEVVVLEKSRGVGGRMATRRVGDATIDHGAQFFTTHTAEFASVVAGEVSCLGPAEERSKLRPASSSGSNVGPTIDTTGARAAAASTAKSTITSSSPAR